MRATPISVNSQNQHLNSAALVISIVAGAAGIIYMVHQIREIGRKAVTHDKETKLLDLQIEKHLQELKQVKQPRTEMPTAKSTVGFAV